MAVSPELRDHVLDMLKGMGAVHARIMFGGMGIFLDDTMFALITAADVTYFRADDGNRAEYEKAGMERFAPFADGRMTMPYYQVPAHVMEDEDEMCAWGRRAWEAARRNKKPARKVARPKPPTKITIPSRPRAKTPAKPKGTAKMKGKKKPRSVTNISVPARPKAKAAGKASGNGKVRSRTKISVPGRAKPRGKAKAAGTAKPTTTIKLTRPAKPKKSVTVKARSKAKPKAPPKIRARGVASATIKGKTNGKAKPKTKTKKKTKDTAKRKTSRKTIH